MSILTSLLLLIVAARILGQLFVRLKQPALVGEILAGVLLGPTALGFLDANQAMSGIAELAMFLIVLSAGLEMNFKDITNILQRPIGLLVAFIGFIIPFLAGIGIGLVFELDVMRTIFLGLCTSITALPVAIRILDSFKLLNHEIAKLSIATAIVNDVIALLILGIILDLPAERDFASVSMSILTTGIKLFLLGIFVVSFSRFLEFIEERGYNIQLLPEKLIKLFGNEALFGVVVGFVLLFGSISDALGFHFVIGAFFGALLIDQKFFLASRYNELERTLASITGGFLAPVFFAYLGLEFKLGSMHSPVFVISVLLVAVLSKIVAGWMGGRLAKLPPHEALGLGIILNGRGVMELVVAGIAYQRGFIGSGLFSTLVLMGVFTTLITPIMFKKWVLSKLRPQPLNF